MGALKPNELWEGVQLQVQEIAFSLFSWNAGRFHFDSPPAAQRERITVDIPVPHAILTGIRRLDASRALRRFLPPDATVLRRSAANPPDDLAPFERHVLDLVDGRRTVGAILEESDIGENESCKVLYALLCLGLTEPAAGRDEPFDHDLAEDEASVASVVAPFNEMYRSVFEHMLREVGPIAENVLDRYMVGLRESRSQVFHGVHLLKDGSVDSHALERNLSEVPDETKRTVLVDALNELLYAELLAVKRTLGAEAEAAVVRSLRAS
jgi:hypothetical protein